MDKVVCEVLAVFFVASEVGREGKGTEACTVEDRTAVHEEGTDLLSFVHGGVHGVFFD